MPVKINDTLFNRVLDRLFNRVPDILFNTIGSEANDRTDDDAFIDVIDHMWLRMGCAGLLDTMLVAAHTIPPPHTPATPTTPPRLTRPARNALSETLLQILSRQARGWGRSRPAGTPSRPAGTPSTGPVRNPIENPISKTHCSGAARALPPDPKIRSEILSKTLSARTLFSL